MIDENSNIIKIICETAKRIHEETKAEGKNAEMFIPNEDDVILIRKMAERFKKERK